MKKTLLVILIISSLIFSLLSCDNAEIQESGEGKETVAGEGGNTDNSTESDNDSSEDGEGSPDADGEGDDSSDAQDNIGDGSGEFVYSIHSKKYHLASCRFVASMNEESKVTFEGTIEELYARGFSPCRTCKPDPNYDYETPSDGSSGDSMIDESSGYTYALNLVSMKFHYSGCSAVKNTNDENKTYSNESRSELVNQGYKPCGICKP